MVLVQFVCHRRKVFHAVDRVPSTVVLCDPVTLTFVDLLTLILHSLLNINI